MSLTRSAKEAQMGMKGEPQIPSGKIGTHSYNTRSKKLVPIEWPLPKRMVKKTKVR